MSDFQNILAIDSAMGGCGAALVTPDQDYCYGMAMARGQAEFLMPFVDDAIRKSGHEYSEIDAIITTVGPGAFTGLRIGMSAAKALAMSLDLPLYGMSTLQALALAFRDKNQKACTVVVETKRKDFYVQAFDEDGCALSEALATDAEDIEVQGGVVIGDAVERLRQERPDLDVEFDAGYTLPDTVLMARLLQDVGENGRFVCEDVQPIYLRGPDVSFSKKKQRVLAAD